jgi:hypothetical protein
MTTQLYRYLQQRLPVMITKMYEDLPYDRGAYLATNLGLQAGAQEVVAERLDEIGDADIIGDGAFDIPIVDISLEEDRYKVFMVGSAMSWSFQQERAMNFSGNLSQLNTRRESIVTRSISERRNLITAYGDTRMGVTGFLNNPGISPVNSSFNFHSGTTPDDMYEFFLNQVRAFDDASNNVMTPRHANVSTNIYYALCKRLPDGTETVKAFLERSLSSEMGAFTIHKDKWSNSALLEANGVHAGSTNKDRITFYNVGSELASCMVEPTAMMPQDYVSIKNGRKVFPFYSCLTAPMFHQLPAFRYVDVPKQV